MIWASLGSRCCRPTAAGRRLATFALGCWIACFAGALQGGFVDVYSIGNSLTVDLSALVLDHLSANEATPLRVGFHAKCGAGLSSIVANPTFCLASDKFGQYPTVFTSNLFDAVTLQPFYGATVRQEVEAAKQIIDTLRANPGNNDTRILIFAAWSENFPNQSFTDTWQTTGATLDSPFVPTKEVYDIYMNELRTTVPEAELLPVGHTFFALAQKINQGLVPGLTSVNDLYRDQIHSSRAGRYVADLVAYSLLYEKSPVGLGYPSLFSSGSGMELSDASARLVAQETAWEVSQNFISVPEPMAPAFVVSAICILATRRRRDTLGTVG